MNQKLTDAPRFMADMKLGHYLHIAPRTLFLAQGLATLVGAVVQCGVTVFMITRIKGVCTSEAEGGFSCPHGRVTYSSSLIWGESSRVESPLQQRIAAQVTDKNPRRPGPGPELLTGPDLRQPAMVLPGRPGGGGHHLGDRPTVEADELPVVAGGLWRNESRAAGDGHQLLVVVGRERCV